MDSIYLDGRHYDRLFSQSGEIAFFREQAELLHQGSALELACGTGKILQPIAEAGFNATGIDLAPGMLAEARRKARAANVSVRYLEADMTKFSLNERFALIVLAGNSICHLHTRAAFQACMMCVREHLADGGRLIVDVHVPKLQLLLVDPALRQPFSEYDDPDGSGRVEVTETSIYDAITQIKSVKTFHKFPRHASEIEGSLELKMYFPQELQALLYYNGLRIITAYGGYDKTALTNTSAKQIYILEAA